MFTLGNGLLLAVALLAGAPHDENVVWTDLRTRGVALGTSSQVTLPEPTMADGLTVAAQNEIVKQVAGDAYPVPRFIRKSPVSPYVLQQRLIENPTARGREVHAWFIAYGDLDQLEDTRLIDRVMRPEDEPDADLANTGKSLDAEELKSRGIPWDKSRENVEIYAHGSFTLWKRVEVESTLRTYWTRTEDSVIVAVAIDRRFDKDAEFSNQWRPLVQQTNGQLEPGTPQPFSGMGMYLKVTRLAEPKGALFVEWHLVFSEPEAWFDGANLIGSKLPAIVQSRVRALRRELAEEPKPR